MPDAIIQYLIVCPLIGLAGFVDAIAGGGGLISLPAYMLAGLPVHNAIGTNKLSSSMGAALSTARFAKSGFIELKYAVPCALTALLGSAIGAKLAFFIPDRTFKLIMLFVLPLVALYVMKGKALMHWMMTEFPRVKAGLEQVKSGYAGSVDDFETLAPAVPAAD